MPAALLLYMAIMAIMAVPRYREEGNWGKFILVVGIGVGLTILLHFVLKRREKIRDEFMKKE